MNDSQALALGPSPDVFLQDLDLRAGGARLLRLTEAQFKAASFLDARIVSPETPSRFAPWAEVETAARLHSAQKGPDFIFHLGHVGSTLLSRMLGDHPQIHALREPPWLRTIAQATSSDPNRDLWPGLPLVEAIPPLVRLTARTFRQDQRTLVKATSFASELGPRLIEASTGARIIALIASPQSHMATLAAGENNLKEVETMGPSRLARLQGRAPSSAFNWPSLSIGEKLAATWLSEMASIASALAAAGQSGLALDFDAFLRDRPAAIDALLQHLGFAADPGMVAGLANSAHLGRYSKAQTHEYSPQLRHQLLSQAWHEHASEIRKGLNWLQRTVAAAPDLQRLLGPFWRG